jgi:hypothetical protein
VLAAAAPLRAQTTALVVHSAPGDPVGQGRTWTFDNGNATFSDSTFANGFNQFRVVASDGRRWALSFVASGNGALVPGTYLSAIELGWPMWTSADVFAPRLLISGPGSCSKGAELFHPMLRSTGRFLVRELVRAADGTIVRFAADFEQHCNDMDAGLWGVLRYNSTISSLVAFDGAVPDYRLIVARPQHGRVTGLGITCGTNDTRCVLNLPSPQTVTLRAEPDPGYVFVGWNASCRGVSTLVVRVNQPKHCEPFFERADAPHTGVYIDSQPRDAIAKGLRTIYNIRNASFRLEVQSPETVAMKIDDGPIFLSDLWFMAPRGRRLVPGSYFGAVFLSEPGPAMYLGSFFDTFRECSSISGRFVVHEAVYAADGSLTRLAVDAEQHCNETDPALFAAVRFNSTLPPAPPFGGDYPQYRVTIVPGAHGIVTGTGLACGAGRTDCAKTLTTPTDLVLTATPDPGYALREWIGDCRRHRQLSRIVSLRVNGTTQCQPVFGPSAVTRDLDGDRAGDLVVWRPGSGSWFWATSSSGFDDSAARARQFGSGAQGDVPFLGDIDGDGVNDLIVWRDSERTFYWLFSSTGFDPAIPGSMQMRNLGPDAVVPMVADMDGDALADFVVWRRTDGVFRSQLSSLSYFNGHFVQWGNPALGDQPLLGDFDGDGRGDFAVWRPGTGTWYWLPSSADYAYAAARGVQWGSSAHDDRVFTGDLDGDARSELIVWRPGDGTWYWLTAASDYAYPAQRSRQWGNAAQGDRPALLDMDGDRILDLTVWRAPTGTWYWLPSSSGFDPRAARAKSWGSHASGDIPMVR